MLLSRIPSPSSVAGQQEDHHARWNKTESALAERSLNHAAALVPWSPADGQRLADSLPHPMPARVRGPRLCSSIEEVGLRSVVAKDDIAAVPNPSTPLPNTGKRRRAIANLSRTIPHPSHSVRMAQIFQKAASEIRNSSRGTAASGSTPANSKKTRIPFPTARRFNSKRAHDPRQENSASPTPAFRLGRISPTRSELIDAFPTPPLPYVRASPKATSRTRQEPVSSGFSTPTKSPHRFTDLVGVTTSTVPPDENDYDGIQQAIVFDRHVIPNSEPSRVDEWLNGVLDIPPMLCSRKVTQSHNGAEVPGPFFPSTSPHLSRPIPHLKRHVSTTSNKENIAPSTIALSWSSIASSTQRKRLHPTSQLRSKEARAQRYQVPPNSPQRKSSRSSSSFSIRDLPRRRIARTSAQVFGAFHVAPPGLLTNAPRKKKAKVNPSASSSDNGTRLEGSAHSCIFSDHGSSIKVAKERIQRYEAFSEVDKKIEMEKENVNPFEASSEAENECFERVKSLSPNVEVFRKGRGPRKERCGSYWDEDVLEVQLQDGRGKGSENEMPGMGTEMVEFSMEKGFTRSAVLGG